MLLVLLPQWEEGGGGGRKKANDGNAIHLALRCELRERDAFSYLTSPHPDQQYTQPWNHVGKVWEASYIGRPLLFKLAVLKTSPTPGVKLFICISHLSQIKMANVSVGFVQWGLGVGKPRFKSLLHSEGPSVSPGILLSLIPLVSF